MRARAVGLRGRTLKSRLSGDIQELQRHGLRYAYLCSTWYLTFYNAYMDVYGDGSLCKNRRKCVLAQSDCEGRTLKSRLSGDTWELERGIYSYTIPDFWPIIWRPWVYMGMADWAKTSKNVRSRSWTGQAHPTVTFFNTSDCKSITPLKTNSHFPSKRG